MEKILIALDYAPAAQKVAEQGFQLAKAMEAKVVLMHVMADSVYYSSLEYSPVMGFGGLGSPDFFDIEKMESLRKAGLDFLEKSKQHLGDGTIETVITEGDTAESILDQAKRVNADIIVLGSHGRSGLGKLLMGSVAEKVLHSTTVPIFIIPTKDDQ